MKKLILLCCILLFSACASVKPYQKMYLNDDDMALKATAVDAYGLDAESYREGAAGANSGKIGAGCGCN